MTRRDVLSIAAAVAAGCLWGFAITRAGPELQRQLVGEGRWLAAAWLVAATARSPAGALISAVAFVLALQGALDLLHWTGIEHAARHAGLSHGEAADVAGAYDATEFVWPRTLAGALVAGAGAALWRAGHRAGAGVLAGALAADLAAGAEGVVPVALAVIALAVAATIVRTPRAVAAAVALALVPVAIAWSGVHLSDDWIVGAPEIAVIR